MGNTVRKRDLSSSGAAANAMSSKSAKGAKKKRQPLPPVPMSPLSARVRPGTGRVGSLPETPVTPEELAFAHHKRTLKEDFDIFLLDNILLSVRFFENFDTELSQLRNLPLSENESKCNSGLYEHGRHCIWPDKLHERVSQHVAFRPKHGANKKQTEALSSRRIMVVHSNVSAVQASQDNSGFSTYGTYKLAVVSANCEGYVKLRSINAPNKRRISYEVIDSTKSDDTIYAEHSDSLISEGTDYSREENNFNNRYSSAISHASPPSPPPPPPPQPFHEKTIAEGTNDTDHNYGGSTLSPGKQILQDIEKRIGNLSTCTKSELSHVPPYLQITDVSTSQNKHILGPQNPALISSEVENRLSARKLSGTGRGMQYHLKANIELKPAKSHSDLDKIGQKTIGSRLSPPSSESSGYKSVSPHRSGPSSRGSDSDYGYTTITELKTPRPVQTRRLGHMPEESCSIPSQCFIRVKVRTIQSRNFEDSGSESDEIYSKSYTQPKSRKLYEEHYYLNSTVYMASFADIFVEKISGILGFLQENVEVAKMQGDKIYCDTTLSLTEKVKMKTRMDITPSIHCKSWPVEAFEWHMRQRESYFDRSQNTVYVWPTREMINKVMNFGYHILPIGYMPTHGSNSDNHVQWQIAFPEAESYLEHRLSHPQIFCFLFALALQKNFLDPLVNSELKLLPSHIRSVLFWECEKNYAAWKEYNLGESLLKLLKAINDCLKKNKLPDYFIRTHNKFESIPARNLRKIHAKLHVIIENPVKFALITVRNLYYIEKPGQQSFYPKFDYKKLDDIVSAENYAKLLNPLFSQQSNERSVDADDETSGEEEESESFDLDREWFKEARRDYEAKKAAKKFTTAPKISTESINVTARPLKNDPMRSKLVLELFIPHFIEMAKCSNIYRAHSQAMFYLKHAANLTRLLDELPVSEKSITDMFMSQIKSEQKLTIASQQYSSSNQRLLRPTTSTKGRQNESSTDRSPTLTRKDSSREITIVDVHHRPKPVTTIEIPAECDESIDL